MILTATMLDIDHRVVLLALIVTRRGIDHQRTPRLIDLGVIMNGTHLAVRHILHLEVIHPSLNNLNGTRPAAAAVECLAGRVGS